jgi:hypothetical protein
MPFKTDKQRKAAFASMNEGYTSKGKIAGKVEKAQRKTGRTVRRRTPPTTSTRYFSGQHNVVENLEHFYEEIEAVADDLTPRQKLHTYSVTSVDKVTGWITASNAAGITYDIQITAEDALHVIEPGHIINKNEYMDRPQFEYMYGNSYHTTKNARKKHIAGRPRSKAKAIKDSDIREETQMRQYEQ